MFGLFVIQIGIYLVNIFFNQRISDLVDFFGAQTSTICYINNLTGQIRVGEWRRWKKTANVPATSRLFGLYQAKSSLNL